MAYFIIFRLKTYDQPVILSDEHQDLRWLSCPDAIKLSGYEDMAKVLQNFNKEAMHI